MDKKYIDTDALYEKIHNIGGCDAPLDTWAEGWDKAIDGCLNLLESMPSADVQEVRHGKWIDTEPKYDYENHCAAHYQCSECGRRTGIKQTRTYKYCPRCGARMDGEE